MRKVICHECGKPFPSRSNNGKYCSDKCKKAVRRIQTANNSAEYRKRKEQNISVTDFNDEPYGDYLKAIKESKRRL